MKEYYYDKLLNIKTRGTQRTFPDSSHHNPYQPTSYRALEALFQAYHLKPSDHVVDFGCGKGRLSFYIYYFYHVTVTGVEMNRSLYNEAIRNRRRYLDQTQEHTDKIHFQHGMAEAYRVDPSDNRFYFFNPFSVEIFMKVIHNILHSAAEYKRDIELIVYYGSDEYVDYLENNTAFELKKEITLSHIFNGDPYDRFLIYRLGTEMDPWSDRLR
ncbi:class I SAM-dependent methyltransferase [Lentibacillus sp. CBA3610]|uniref:class I SAM-dependent methyltransferase n=1 Tax=Lentibacillus sp. CBA3610 TaxID=2518176 RepID=UPI001595E024|nr:methyltransferase [Lentibacillus sp. CBA3610]QKY68441.1 methyltransferase [Lentibacillus sp. CBA3610]